MTPKKIRYYVCGIGYDKNECVTYDEWNFGDFDTYEEALKLYKELEAVTDTASFFEGKHSDTYQMQIQLEECEESDLYDTECIDVKKELWIENPRFLR